MKLLCQFRAGYDLAHPCHYDWRRIEIAFIHEELRLR
jgi:hypothetical protein